MPGTGTLQDLLNSSRESYIEQNAVDIHIQDHPLLNVFWNQRTKQSGGSTIDFRVRTNQPGALNFYSGVEVPQATPQEIIENATLPWRKAIYEMIIEGDISYQNKGEGEIIDLAMETMDAGMAGLTEELSFQLINGTGAAGQLHGLPAVFTAGYGGVVDPQWDNVAVSGGAGNLTVDMIDDAITQLQERGGKPQVIVMSRANRRQINVNLTSDVGGVRFETPGNKSLDIGPPSRLFYGGTEILVDPDMPDNLVYILDLRKFNLVLADDPNRMFSLTPWEYQINATRETSPGNYRREDAFRSYALFAGNFICRDRRRQAVIGGAVASGDELVV